MDERPTPADADIPGGWIETPSSFEAQQLRQEQGLDLSGEATPTPRANQPTSSSYFGRTTASTVEDKSTALNQSTSTHPTRLARGGTFGIASTTPGPEDAYAATEPAARTTSDNTNGHSSLAAPIVAAVPTRHDSEESTILGDDYKNKKKSSDSASSSVSSAYSTEPTYAAVRVPSQVESPGPSTAKQRPPLGKTTTNGSTKRFATEDDLFRALSRRRTNASNVDGDDVVDAESQAEESAEIERLMSRLFGKARQEQSQEEKTRHAGVVFRNLTVKGAGLGASLQPTVGDFFVGLPRFLGQLFTKGVKAATGKPPVRDLLSDFNGCVRPGEMLLVLGRPGAGCTTFLKVFCNQRAGYVEVAGDVTYGGATAEEMEENYRSELSYNPEDDLHFATLSVRRTLSFALQTKTPGKESRLEGESREDYINEFLRVTSKLLWIEHTMDTKVGDEYVRGVSGGERKRVSIAEVMIARSSVAGWDNSSKGLDASTASQYVAAVRTLTNMASVSSAVSLYQAGETLYEAFDKVLLIHEGKCLYYGFADHAKQYFIDLGFDCPPRWTTSDFLTNITEPHGRIVRKGCEDKIPRTAEDFERIFRQSEAYKRNMADIEDFESTLESQQRELRENLPDKKKDRKKNFTIAFHKQVLAITHRQLFVLLGDKASLIGKWGGIVFQGLIVGSLFFQLPPSATSAFSFGGVMFFLLLFNALLALAEQTAAFEAKPILLRHKNLSMYRPSAYALAQTLVDIPMVFVQVVLFLATIYFMSNLALTASQFFICLLTLWTITMTTYSFFRSIAAVFKTLDDATKLTGVAIQILIVYTGYLQPPSEMRPWFGWLRWINWLQYGFEMLMANQFAGLELACEPPLLVPQGPNASPEYQSCALTGSQPGRTTVDGANYIEASFTYTRAHLWRNFGFIFAFWAVFLVITCIGMERMKPNAGGAATTVFKRGQVPKNVEKNIETGARHGKKGDEESGSSSPGALIGAGSEDEVREKEEQERRNEQAMERVEGNSAVFTFQDVNYTIPYEGGERKLLDNVQGYVKPGKLTALMGASGAGKTTLLNILAQRTTFGTITGDFLLDGRPLPKSFQRATGFAEQMDVHEPTATVLEALRFSALLRQPKETPIQEKYDYCETIIDLLEMRDIAGAVIGSQGAGLNQEQRKRLTIGVELASKPELLMFLDEPTSGLDSGAAANIVRFLQKLAQAGQAVLCTIHQPSAVLFEHFDELILLKSGGRVVYAGELGKDSQTLIRYFETHHDKESRRKGDSDGIKCPPDANPAEWMLDTIGAGNPDYEGQDWGDTWRDSENHREQAETIQKLIEERKSAPQPDIIKDDREYAMPLWTQTSAVVKRAFVAYWRSPNYIAGKLILHVFTALFNGATFYALGSTQIDFQSRLFTIFLVVTTAPPLIQQLQPVFLRSRNIFTSRENNAKIYSWFAWTTGAVVAELPYAIVAGAVYFCCWWFLINDGMHQAAASMGNSAFVFLVVILFELYYVGFGQAIASFSPNELLASLLVPLFFLFVVSFCGVVVPAQALPEFWRTWMYPLTPFRYLIEAFLGVAIHNLPLRCQQNEFARFPAPPGLTCESYVGPFIEQLGGQGYVQVGSDGLCEYCQFSSGDAWGAGQFNVFYSSRWRDVGIICGFIMFNFAVVYLATFLRFRGKNPLKKLLAKRKK
ncbi:brefeldin A resistance protein [Microdochium bolleyi]|uniref:Brefeldin A resistance protein n=1 Tax=Microdochium bolleyi TaxID=196109 RepID=A0A136IR32_9PEZI|nr:brefeldin A resistance protein [Microdochium bolleyi]